MPGVKGLVRIFWFAFFMSYVANWYTKSCAAVACAVGILKKAGIPSYAGIQLWVQDAILAPEFHTMTYLMATFMCPGGLFVDAPIMIAAGVYLIGEMKSIGEKSGTFPFNVEYVKNMLEKGTSP